MNDYNVRPGYGSGKLLIEFAPKAADQEFFADLLGVLESIGTRVHDIEELWMNDEVLLHCESDHGNFIVSKDIWDLVFIMAPGNQPVIAKIDEALSRSDSFRKTSVNEEDYS
ncbi:hypothetical protein [uncultured Gimesia sp.]|uniref:hypothetical protein n=1 Tax=uncultured Gimesia sp. TaxID=1678688 RepID=UPI0026160FF5|nr:hypothetical protein [uncultured Gimesia sp.]